MLGEYYRPFYLHKASSFILRQKYIHESFDKTELYTFYKTQNTSHIGLDTMILLTKGTELTISCQLKIPMKLSINLNKKNLKASKLSTYDFSTL